MSTTDIHDAILNACVSCYSKSGTMPTHCYLNFVDFRAFELQLQEIWKYGGFNRSTEPGVPRTIQVYTIGGTVEVSALSTVSRGQVVVGFSTPLKGKRYEPASESNGGAVR